MADVVIFTAAADDDVDAAAQKGCCCAYLPEIMSSLHREDVLFSKNTHSLTSSSAEDVCVRARGC